MEHCFETHVCTLEPPGPSSRAPWPKPLADRMCKATVLGERRFLAEEVSTPTGARLCLMLNHFPHAARPPHPVPSFALIFRDHRAGFATSGLLRLGTRRKGHRWRTVEVSDCPRWMCGFGDHWLSDLETRKLVGDTRSPRKEQVRDPLSFPCTRGRRGPQESTGDLLPAAEMVHPSRDKVFWIFSVAQEVWRGLTQELLATPTGNSRDGTCIRGIALPQG